MFSIFKKQKEALLLMEETIVDLNKDVIAIRQTLARTTDKQRELSNAYRQMNDAWAEAAGEQADEIDLAAREEFKEKKKKGFFKLKH